MLQVFESCRGRSVRCSNWDSGERPPSLLYAAHGELPRRLGYSHHTNHRLRRTMCGFCFVVIAFPLLVPC